MRKEEQPIVEPVAFLVANATIPHEPVKAKGWSNEPFPAFYPADRESDAQEAARILRAVCEPLYPASTMEALQAEVELKADEISDLKAFLVVADKNTATAQSEASALRKRVEELSEMLRMTDAVLGKCSDIIVSSPDHDISVAANVEWTRRQVRTLTEGGKDG